tara:strand:- start:194 stop:349 length:156 start_codon:yes stop_codon:yes gene_type:complete
MLESARKIQEAREASVGCPVVLETTWKIEKFSQVKEISISVVGRKMMLEKQ